MKVASERTLRAEGGEPIDVRRADQFGSVTFASGVEDGARYLAVGVVDRHPLEVRARGRQRPHRSPRPSPTAPHLLRRALDTPTAETSARRQEDVHGVPQRSDTAKGTATPLE